jgi:hypothetical protein
MLLLESLVPVNTSVLASSKRIQARSENVNIIVKFIRKGI